MQLNFDGEWVEPKEPQKAKRQTMRSAFRQIYGYNSEHQCKECRFIVKGRYNSKNLIKCEKLGLTHSEATDIREKDPACKLFELKIELGGS